jgi:small-conductance mechanosensitive channel
MSDHVGMRKWWEQASAEFSKPENWLRYAETGVRVVIILAVAWLITRLVRRWMRRLRTYIVRVMDKRGAGSALEMENRAATIIALLSKLSSTAIWLVAVVMALSQLGEHVEPLIAGLGVAGVAVGFGAQTLIKDWLAGLFILLEDQVRIGDAVTINGIGGAVEEMNLRTTVLRAENGAVYTISNGSITTLANMTRDYSYYVFETTVAHGADVDRALAIVSEEGARIAQEEPYRSFVVAPIEIMGVDRLGDRGATLKARIKTLPSQQWAVGRELNRRVKASLDAAGIAFPQVVST